MAKKSGSVIVVKVEVTLLMLEHLESLVETGLYGVNIQEAASRLIAEGIERRIGPIRLAPRDPEASD
jgi:hypothetical protein